MSDNFNTEKAQLADLTGVIPEQRDNPELTSLDVLHKLPEPSEHKRNSRLNFDLPQLILDEKDQSKDSAVEKEEGRLLDALNEFNPEIAEEFDKLSAQFKERASQQDISEEAQLATYKSLQKMISNPEISEAKVGQTERMKAALEFMYHAADPSTIDQGTHGTCNVSTIEHRMISKYPEKVADLLAQVSLTGKWTAPDGKIIDIDDQSLVPGDEERHYPPQNGNRSFASQIFQVTALNDLGQRGELFGSDGKPVHYFQDIRDESSDLNSVRLYGDYLKFDKSGELAEFRGVKDDTTQKELSRMTGETAPHVIVNIEKDRGRGEGVIHINSEQKLLNELLQLKGSPNKENDLPAILAVFTWKPPFNQDPGVAHVISISDLRQTSDGNWQVYLDNQWGKSSGWGKPDGNDGWYPLSEIYEASKPQ